MKTDNEITRLHKACYVLNQKIIKLQRLNTHYENKIKVLEQKIEVMEICKKKV